jgi:thiosulfate reductase cytochrome b subunit
LDTEHPNTLLYRRHAWPVRVMHWINVLAFFLMLMSGLMIFNAHPTLYWGKQSYADAPVVLHIEPPPGHFGHSIPAWMTIPTYYSLAKARRWHFFFMWLFVANGLTLVLWSVASRHLSRDLWPNRRDIAGIGRSVIDHLRFRHPTGEAARRYNILQKVAYLAVIFILLPMMVVTGFAMSPGLNAVWPGWVDWLGGRQSARTIHFITAGALVAFLLAHVLMVIATGPWNGLRSMITGRYRIRQGETTSREPVGGAG